MRPMAWRDLLLVGMAMSTNLRDASVSQNAMTLQKISEWHSTSDEEGIAVHLSPTHGMFT